MILAAVALLPAPTSDGDGSDQDVTADSHITASCAVADSFLSQASSSSFLVQDTGTGAVNNCPYQVGASDAVDLQGFQFLQPVLPIGVTSTGACENGGAMVVDAANGNPGDFNSTQDNASSVFDNDHSSSLQTQLGIGEGSGVSDHHQGGSSLDLDDDQDDFEHNRSRGTMPSTPLIWNT